MMGRIIGASVGLAAIVALVAVAPLFGASGSESLSAYPEPERERWDTVSEARRALDIDHDVRNIGASSILLGDLDAQRSMLVVVGMERPYSDAEAKGLDAFLRRGGTILLLDDFGYGKDYAQRHGIDFLPRPLFDNDFDRNQSFVRVEGTVDGKTYRVLLNGPAALGDVGSDSDIQVVLRSSADSYLDLNDDAKVGVEDKIGPFNVALRRSVGQGTLMVVSDSGWIVNGMIDRADNRAFLMALAESAIGTDGTVVFDESRRPAAGLEVGFYAMQRSMITLLRSIPLTGLFFTVGAVGLGLLAIAKLPGREPWVHRFRPRSFVAPPTRPSEHDLLASLLEGARDVAQTDPQLAAALAEPDAVRKEDLPVLVRRLAQRMALEPADIERLVASIEPAASGAPDEGTDSTSAAPAEDRRPLAQANPT